MKLLRAILLLSLLCLPTFSSAVVAVSACTADGGGPHAQVHAAADCCGDESHAMRGETCDGASCAAHCAGAALFAGARSLTVRAQAHILAAAPVQVPPPAPVFHEERPPRRPV